MKAPLEFRRTSPGNYQVLLQGKPVATARRFRDRWRMATTADIPKGAKRGNATEEHTLTAIRRRAPAWLLGIRYFQLQPGRYVAQRTVTGEPVAEIEATGDDHGQDSSWLWKWRDRAVENPWWYDTPDGQRVTMFARSWQEAAQKGETVMLLEIGEPKPKEHQPLLD